MKDVLWWAFIGACMLLTIHGFARVSLSEYRRTKRQK
jgi:hypothetical protein